MTLESGHVGWRIPEAPASANARKEHVGGNDQHEPHPRTKEKN